MWVDSSLGSLAEAIVCILRKLENKKAVPIARTAETAVPPRLATVRVAHLVCRYNGRRPVEIAGMACESRLRGDTTCAIALLGFHHPEFARAIGATGVFPSVPLPFSTGQPTTSG